jgi:hypothetical protein
MIYVDELKDHGWLIRGKAIPSCHLLTDGDIEKLHIFAERLGLKRYWFQNKRHPHYDLVPARRRLAVGLGAIEITTKEWVKKERAKIVLNTMTEVAFDIIDPEFSNIEKKILDKIDEEAFASGGIPITTANTFGSNRPCSLTIKDLEMAFKKLNESIPSRKLFYENVVNEAEVEILLPDAVDIKKDEWGKIISFMCWGVHFTVTKYCPKGSVLSFDVPKFKLNLKD